jgi:hypothetical protein
MRKWTRRIFCAKENVDHTYNDEGSEGELGNVQ